MESNLGRNRNGEIEFSMPLIIKNQNKCILCRRCVDTCGEIQNINVCSIIECCKDLKTITEINESLSEFQCVYCGLCVKECPTGALTIKEDYFKLIDVIENEDTTVVAFIDPNISLQISKDKRVLSDEIIIAGLKHIGVDYVLSTSKTQSEAIEKALTNNANKMPLIYSDCYAVSKMVEMKFPNATIVNSSFHEDLMKYASKELHRLRLPVNDHIYALLITASIGQKVEAIQAGMDFVLTPLDLEQLFLLLGVENHKLQPEGYDIPDSVCSITLLPFKFGINILSGKINKKTAKIAKVQGLRNAENILNLASSGYIIADIIQLAACPGEQPDISTILFN